MEMFAPYGDQSAIRAIGPIIEPARALSLKLREAPLQRLLQPNRLARARVERFHQSDCVRGEENPVDEYGSRVQVGRNGKPGIPLQKPRIKPGTTPEYLKTLHVFGIDLGERRIAREGAVRPVVAPPRRLSYSVRSGGRQQGPQERAAQGRRPSSASRARVGRSCSRSVRFAFPHACSSRGRG